jgi:hypothetical protein
MRIGITAWIMVAVLSEAGSAFAQEPAAPPSTIPSEPGTASPNVLGTGKALSLSGCRMRPYREDPMRAPFLLIEEGPIPGSDPDRSLTSAETKCVKSLRKAGKKAIERGKITESIFHYLSAVDTAPGLAGEIYLDLASALDQTAYTQPAVIAYRKAWRAFEAGYNRPGVQVEGRVLLTLADIRDSIVRLGGQVPAPTSEPGKIVAANSTRKIQEQYFKQALPPVAPR